MDAKSRLLAKLENIHDPNACWPFRGASKGNGYGNFYLEGKVVGAHVAAYRLFVGPVPEGKEIDHRCHKADECDGGVTCPHRACCNWRHLQAVTHRENDLRGRGVSAVNAAKTHCHLGHPFDDENTYRDPKGVRYCLACRRARDRKRYQPCGEGQ